MRRFSRTLSAALTAANLAYLAELGRAFLRGPCNNRPGDTAAPRSNS
jgi:hypothetical protein